MQVEQRHRDHARAFMMRSDAYRRWGVDQGEKVYNDMAETLAAFEASLPPSAPVDRDAATTAVVGALTWIREFCRSKREGTDDWFDLVEIEARCSDALASLGTPSVLAESTSNDCLLVAEAGELRKALEAAAGLVFRIEHAGVLECEGVNFDRWKETAREIAPSLRAALSRAAAVTDLSGVGVG
jgi:hypothetical protein